MWRQQEIGHEHLKWGLISTKWQQAQKRFEKKIDILQEYTKLASKVIKALHTYHYSIWKHRCQQLCTEEEDNSITPTKEDAIREIETLMKTPKNSCRRPNGISTTMCARMCNMGMQILWCLGQAVTYCAGGANRKKTLGI